MATLVEDNPAADQLPRRRTPSPRQPTPAHQTPPERNGLAELGVIMSPGAGPDEPLTVNGYFFTLDDDGRIINDTKISTERVLAAAAETERPIFIVRHGQVFRGQIEPGGHSVAVLDRTTPSSDVTRAITASPALQEAWLEQHLETLADVNHLVGTTTSPGTPSPTPVSRRTTPPVTVPAVPTPPLPAHPVRSGVSDEGTELEAPSAPPIASPETVSPGTSGTPTGSVSPEVDSALESTPPVSTGGSEESQPSAVGEEEFSEPSPSIPSGGIASPRPVSNIPSSGETESVPTSVSAKAPANEPQAAEPLAPIPAGPTRPAGQQVSRPLPAPATPKKRRRGKQVTPSPYTSEPSAGIASGPMASGTATTPTSGGNINDESVTPTAAPDGDATREPSTAQASRPRRQRSPVQPPKRQAPQASATGPAGSSGTAGGVTSAATPSSAAPENETTPSPAFVVGPPGIPRRQRPEEIERAVEEATAEESPEQPSEDATVDPAVAAALLAAQTAAQQQPDQTETPETEGEPSMPEQAATAAAETGGGPLEGVQEEATEQGEPFEPMPLAKDQTPMETKSSPTSASEGAPKSEKEKKGEDDESGEEQGEGGEEGEEEVTLVEKEKSKTKDQQMEQWRKELEKDRLRRLREEGWKGAPRAIGAALVQGAMIEKAMKKLEEEERALVKIPWTMMQRTIETEAIGTMDYFIAGPIALGLYAWRWYAGNLMGDSWKKEVRVVKNPDTTKFGSAGSVSSKTDVTFSIPRIPPYEFGDPNDMNRHVNFLIIGSMSLLVWGVILMVILLLTNPLQVLSSMWGSVTSLLSAGWDAIIKLFPAIPT